jgi:hypothetical protein
MRVQKLTCSKDGFLVTTTLASVILLKAVMASTTLGSRYFKAGETHLVILVAILLSSTWLITFDWIPLALELNLLWLSDDLLSWRRLNHQPGPWLAGLSSLPIVWHIWKGDFYEWLERLHSERGSIIRKSDIYRVWLPSLTLTLTQALGLIDFRHPTRASSAN